MVSRTDQTMRKTKNTFSRPLGDHHFPVLKGHGGLITDGSPTRRRARRRFTLAKRLVCMSNLREWGIAIHNHYDDNDSQTMKQI